MAIGATCLMKEKKINRDNLTDMSFVAENKILHILRDIDITRNVRRERERTRRHRVEFD